MLQIKNISKKYKTGDLVQVALDKVSVNLRDNEFVAILGPSGSGKTTLLNIIGGLDHYDSGDLIINNVSTKKYKDRDWDSYRNHSIGFVFQSYNLIPHQTVLSNVEMSLTIGGIKGKKRKQLAINALEKVGLKDQIHKKPNQMSGGQMQRVAIARALVNDPKILLADEPTGALDTTTSIQVMELLKEVAKDRLVVMVTHNPELAEQYANRIVKIKDGHIESDSNPLIIEESKLDKPKHKRLGKASMSIFTALRLSLNNLLTKKARTFLTAFAGSIGIIGIALILSLSTGFDNYIDKIQEDTLTSYPLSFNKDTADISSLILGIVSESNQSDGSDVVVEQQYLSSMFSSIGTNDLPAFIEYTNKHSDELEGVVTKMKYSYSVSPTIYTIDVSDDLVKLNPSEMLNTMYSDSAVNMYAGVSSGMGIFNEINDSYDRYKKNYNLLEGKWPEKYNELLLVLSEPNKISDLLVYSLGLRDYDKMNDLIQAVMTGKDYEVDKDRLKFTYDDLLNVKLKLINTSNMYKYNDKYNIYEDMSEDEEFMKNMYKNSEDLIIVGIVAPDPDASEHGLNPGVCYTRDLTLHVMEKAKESELVKKQLKNDEINVFSGKKFDEEDEEEKNKLDFQEMISVDEDILKSAFKVNVDFGSLLSEDKMKDVAMKQAEATTNNLKMIGTLSLAINDLVSQIESTIVDTLTTSFSLVTPGYVYDCVGTDTNDHYEDPTDLSKGCKLSDFTGGELVETETGSGIYVKSNELERYKTDSNYIYISPSTFTAYDLVIDGIMSTPMVSNSINTFVSALTSNIPGGSDFLSADKVKKYISDEIKLITHKTIQTIASENSMTDEIIPTNKNSFDKTLFQQKLKLTASSQTITNDNYNFALNSAKDLNYGVVALGIGTALSDALKPLSEIKQDEMMTIDTKKFAEAFKFDLTEDELSRIMTSLLSSSKEKSYSSNLLLLGYQDVDDPTSISFFFKDFESKEKFIDFVKYYNNNTSEDKEITYTDITGLLMSSVKKIVDSVSYVLIAFVSISLIVSSIMIGIITYISVLERTKEIGILRAIGASKRNISSIFNAETFIVGLLSGLIGVTTTILLNYPINNLIHELTDNYDINAVLPTEGAIILVILSVILTLLAGIIPSSAASRKDPVIALRSE